MKRVLVYLVCAWLAVAGVAATARFGSLKPSDTVVTVESDTAASGWIGTEQTARAALGLALSNALTNEAVLRISGDVAGSNGIPGIVSGIMATGSVATATYAVTAGSAANSTGAVAAAAIYSDAVSNALHVAVTNEAAAREMWQTAYSNYVAATYLTKAGTNGWEFGGHLYLETLVSSNAESIISMDGMLNGEVLARVGRDDYLVDRLRSGEDAIGMLRLDMAIYRDLPIDNVYRYFVDTFADQSGVASSEQLAWLLGSYMLPAIPVVPFRWYGMEDNTNSTVVVEQCRGSNGVSDVNTENMSRDGKFNGRKGFQLGAYGGGQGSGSKYVDCSADGELTALFQDMANRDFSVTCWWKKADFVQSVDCVLFSFGDRVQAEGFKWMANEYYGGRAYMFDSIDRFVFGNGLPQVDTWTHMGVTWNHDTCLFSFYENGTFLASHEIDRTFVTNTLPTVEHFVIGGEYGTFDTGWGYYWGRGTFAEQLCDDFRIYDSLLTATQVSNVWASTSDAYAGGGVVSNGFLTSVAFPVIEPPTEIRALVGLTDFSTNFSFAVSACGGTNFVSTALSSVGGGFYRGAATNLVAGTSLVYRAEWTNAAPTKLKNVVIGYY